VSKGQCSVTITIIDAGPRGNQKPSRLVDLHPEPAKKLYECLYPGKSFTKRKFGVIYGVTVTDGKD